jgi:HD superfamily phosphohydrolase
MDWNSNSIVNTFNTNSNFSLAEENGLSQNSLLNIQSKNHEELGFGNKRTVFDAIHGHIEFDKYVWDFIDTIEFQRLRNLKQLGNCHFIFPGGTHSRFEHSLGTAHLSNRLINHLIKGVREKTCVFNLNNANRINEDFNVKAVTLAGLLHDLGHGPFSHLFDRKVIKFLE